MKTIYFDVQRTVVTLLAGVGLLRIFQLAGYVGIAGY